MPTNYVEYEYTHARPTWDHSLVLPIIRRFLASLPRSAKVADIGCGNGALISTLADFGWALYGLESSVSGLEQARMAFPGITFLHADATKPLTEFLPAESFDAAISVDVIEHIYDPRGFVKSVGAILKPGGTLILTTPYHGYVKNAAVALSGKCDGHYNPLWDCGHIKFWSKRTITALLEEFGFSDLVIAYRGRFPLLWKEMIVKATKPARPAAFR